MSKLYLWRDPGEEVLLGFICLAVLFILMGGSFWLGHATRGCP